MDILASRGVEITPDTASILRREGYYSVVNGYKDLYLDRRASNESGEDAYYPGTTFDDLYELFTFDRRLRQTLFRYFAKAEATLKTQCSYQYMKAHESEKEPYLNPGNYDPKEDAQRIAWLVEDFEVALGRHPKKKPKKKAYLEHYRKNHDEVPLWVLLRYMTLGQAFKFFCYQPESMRNSIAKGFAKLHEDSYGEPCKISPKRLKRAYDHIKDFRNICAHEERLYCARVSPGRNVSVAEVLPDLRLVLTREDSVRLSNDIIDLLVDMSGKMRGGFLGSLMIRMGIGSIQDLLEVK